MTFTIAIRVQSTEGSLGFSATVFSATVVSVLYYDYLQLSTCTGRKLIQYKCVTFTIAISVQSTEGSLGFSATVFSATVVSVLYYDYLQLSTHDVSSSNTDISLWSLCLESRLLRQAEAYVSTRCRKSLVLCLVCFTSSTFRGQNQRSYCSCQWLKGNGTPCSSVSAISCWALARSSSSLQVASLAW